MSRLPLALARRVDRLARRAHAFHRWAHHPLCSWYAGEVIRVGRRTRVCLGCLLTGLGAVAGVALGLVVPAAPGMALLAVGAILLAAVPLIVRTPTPARASTGSARAELRGPLAPGSSARPECQTPLAPRSSARPELHSPLALSLSKGERSRSRSRKLLTRFLPTAVAGFPVAQAALAPSPARVGAAALAAAAVGWVILRYRRRGPDRSACDACPDGPPGSRCPGLAPIARRERALSRLAGRWIAAWLPVPGASSAPGEQPPTCLPPPRPSPTAHSTAATPETPRPS